jgi:hypothetical protein
MSAQVISEFFMNESKGYLLVLLIPQGTDMNTRHEHQQTVQLKHGGKCLGMVLVR